MAKRRVRKNAKQSVSNKNKGDQEGIAFEKKDGAYQDHEVGRQSAVIRALRAVEIDQLQTMLRHLSSYFSEEQLQVPVLQFFKENLPNLASMTCSGKMHEELKSQPYIFFLHRLENSTFWC